MDENTPSNAGPWPLFNLGFRPFFLGAGIFAVVTIFLWMAVYIFDYPLGVAPLNPMQWHAHEMIYGYAMSVMAGFLLTAVKNWTGIQTIYGTRLLLFFCLWVVARILFLFGTTVIHFAVIFDLLFDILLIVAVASPIIKSKNWKQVAILSKLVLLTIGNICFYLGIYGYIDGGVHLSLYGGLYVVLSLILTIGRRVIPFFIERGVGYEVQLYNARWIDISSLLLFLMFFIADLFIHIDILTGVLAIGMFVITIIRLIGWHTPGIWKKPLLWSLYLALLSIATGFLLFAVSLFTELPVFMAVHAFAFGGIGMMSLSMMSRVSLGHTGRDIHAPPLPVCVALVTLVFGTIIRVFMPLVSMQYYDLWIIISQVLWITAFLLFTICYLPILCKPRIDNQFG